MSLFRVRFNGTLEVSASDGIVAHASAVEFCAALEHGRWPDAVLMTGEQIRALQYAVYYEAYDVETGINFLDSAKLSQRVADRKRSR